jgi:hypothetical protein
VGNLVSSPSFQPVKRTIYNGDYKYSAWLTPRGVAVLSGGGGGLVPYLVGGISIIAARPYNAERNLGYTTWPSERELKS